MQPLEYNQRGECSGTGQSIWNTGERNGQLVSLPSHGSCTLKCLKSENNFTKLEMITLRRSEEGQRSVTYWMYIALSCYLVPKVIS